MRTARKIAQGSQPADGEMLDAATRVGRLGRWALDFATLAMDCDARWHAIMGRSTVEDPITTIAAFRQIIHPEDVDRATDIDGALADMIRRDEDYGILFRVIWPQGDVRWIRSLACIDYDDAGVARGATGFVMDITIGIARQGENEAAMAELRMENRVLEAQQRDMLEWTQQDRITGLANRWCFDRDLARACGLAVRQRERLAVALIRIDLFEELKACHGQARSEEALRAVAALVACAARRTLDLAARYDDATFALILQGCTDPRPILESLRMAAGALQVANDGSPIGDFLTLSIGALSSCAIADPDALIRRCDVALHAAREVGHDQVVVVADR